MNLYIKPLVQSPILRALARAVNRVMTTFLRAAEEADRRDRVRAALPVGTRVRLSRTCPMCQKCPAEGWRVLSYDPDVGERAGDYRVEHETEKLLSGSATLRSEYVMRSCMEIVYETSGAGAGAGAGAGQTR